MKNCLSVAISLRRVSREVRRIAGSAVRRMPCGLALSRLGGGHAAKVRCSKRLGCAHRECGDRSRTLGDTIGTLALLLMFDLVVGGLKARRRPARVLSVTPPLSRKFSPCKAVCATREGCLWRTFCELILSTAHGVGRDAFAEGVEVRAAVHLSLYRRDAVDLAAGRA